MYRLNQCLYTSALKKYPPPPRITDKVFIIKHLARDNFCKVFIIIELHAKY
jgi:hypothetical protein